jgi:hypothetical protein
MRVALILVLVVAAFALHLEEESDGLPNPSYYAATNDCRDALNEVLGFRDGTLIYGGSNFKSACHDLEIEIDEEGDCSLTGVCRGDVKATYYIVQE